MEKFLSLVGTPEAQQGLGISEAGARNPVSMEEFQNLLVAPNQSRPEPSSARRTSAVGELAKLRGMEELTSDELGGNLQAFALLNSPAVEAQLATLEEKFPGQVEVQGNNLVVTIQGPTGPERKVLNSPGFSVNDVALIPVGVVQALAGVLSGGVGNLLTAPLKGAIGKAAGGLVNFGVRALSETAAGVGADEAIANLAGQDFPGLESLDARLQEQAFGEAFGLAAKTARGIVGLPRKFVTQFRTADQVNAGLAGERLNVAAGAPSRPGVFNRMLGRGSGDRIEQSLGEATNRPEIATFENISANQPSLLFGGGDRARRSATENVISKARENVSAKPIRTAQEAGAESMGIISKLGKADRTNVADASRDLEIAARVQALGSIAETGDLNLMAQSKEKMGRTLQLQFGSVRDRIKNLDGENFQRESDLIDQIVAENPDITGKVDVSNLVSLAENLIEELPTARGGEKIVLDDVDSFVASKLSDLDPRQALTQLRAMRKQLRNKSAEIAGVTGSRRERALSLFESGISEAIDGFVDELVTKGVNSSPETLALFKEAHTVAIDTFKANRALLKDQGLDKLFVKENNNFVVGPEKLVDSLAKDSDKFRAALNLMSSQDEQRTLKSSVLAAVAQKSKFDLTTEGGDASTFISNINSLPDGVKSQLLFDSDILAFRSMSEALEKNKEIRQMAANTAIDPDDVVRLIDEAPENVGDFIVKLVRAKNNQARNSANEIMQRFKNADLAVVDQMQDDQFVYELLPHTKNAKDLGDFMGFIEKQNPGLATDIRSLVFERVFTNARQRTEQLALRSAKETVTEGSAIRGLKPSEILRQLPTSADIMKNIGGEQGSAKLAKILTPEQFQVLNDSTIFLMNQENVRRVGGEQAGQLAAQNLSFKVLTELKGGFTSAKIKLMGRLFGDPNIVEFLTKAEAAGDRNLVAALRTIAPPLLRQSIGKGASNAEGQAVDLISAAAVQEIEQDLGAPASNNQELLQEIDAQP
tara:strand:- start:4805 stop:7780 length:2976 start_codon:yes stop_codon:yes gene_type:complete